jgi:hypothetical protein
MKIRCGCTWFVVLALGSAFSCFAQTAAEGQAAYARGDYPAALGIWRGLAGQGNAGAQVRLGLMYARGHGVPRDDAEAVRLYREAAEQGDAWGETNLGYMYSTGRGVAKDDVAAVRWYRKAAEQDFAMAQDNLGVMYRDGRGVANDDAEAAKWYRKAAEQGYANAKSNLNQMYAEGRVVAQASAVPPAAGEPGVAKTYAVVSMIGDRLNLVTRKTSNGTRLDHYDRRTEPLTDDLIASTVLRTMARAVADVAPGAKTELLEIDWKASQGSGGVSNEEPIAIARHVLRDKAMGRSWDYIVVLGARREHDQQHLMGQDLEGLGFYVDPGSTRGFNPRQAPGNVVKADRFISPFVSSQLWFLDAKTLDVVAAQPIYGYCRYISAKGDSLDPWHFFDSAEMLRFLTLAIQHDVGEGTRKVMRKGLGLPQGAMREHVEFCTHRFD